MDNFFKDKEKKKILFHIYINMFFCSSVVLVALCSKHVAHSPCAVSFFLFFMLLLLLPFSFILYFIATTVFFFLSFSCLKKRKVIFKENGKKGTRPEPKSNLLKRMKHEMMFYDGANQCFISLLLFLGVLMQKNYIYILYGKENTVQIYNRRN